MTSRQKQNNRYAAAARKLCQLDEQCDRCSKAIDEVFGGMYRRETRPAEAVKYLRSRNYTHFKLSKRCALKR